MHFYNFFRKFNFGAVKVLQMMISLAVKVSQIMIPSTVRGVLSIG